MKYIKQFLWILAVSFVGEFLNYVLPFPIPGNIYGMMLMFILLLSGCIKMHQIRETAKFLIDIMPILFIPAAVGIITKIDELKTIWWQIVIIVVFTTVIVMAVSGWVTQMVIRKNRIKMAGKNNLKKFDFEK